MTDRYRELGPAADLSRWVECAWEVRSGGGPRRVLPDGCMDVIWTPLTGLQVVGVMTEAFVADLEPGAEAVGVRFHVGAGPALLGLPAEDLRDARVGVAELWGAAGERLAERVAAAGAHTRARVLLDWVRERGRDAPAPDPVVRAAARVLGGAPSTSTAQLARRLNLSERQLRRRVGAEVGYGPKRLARVLRLQRAVATAHARSRPDLAWLALEAGYADQSHFTNDCVALAGIPPGRLLAA